MNTNGSPKGTNQLLWRAFYELYFDFSNICGKLLIIMIVRLNICILICSVSGNGGTKWRVLNL